MVRAVVKSASVHVRTGGMSPVSMMRSEERIMAVRKVMSPMRRTVAMNPSPQRCLQVSWYCRKVSLNAVCWAAVRVNVRGALPLRMWW